MNFMANDDHMLLMSHCEHRAREGFDNNLYILSVSDRERLKGAGIQTAHEQPGWLNVEPKEGQYNWDYVDVIVNRNRNAGLKSLIQLGGWMLPSWIPDDWKAQCADGTYELETLSIWNEEGQSAFIRYYKAVMEHYKDTFDVGFFHGDWQGGEGVMPSTHCYFDRAARENYKSLYGTNAVINLETPETTDWFHNSIIKNYMQKGKIFYDCNKEIWNCQQRLMDRWSKAFGNHVQPEIMRMYRELYPDASLVLLQYTYFDSSHTQDEHDWVDNIIKISQCETIVEAMFCDGLRTTTPAAIAKGFQGQIVHPAHSTSNHYLDQQDVDRIKKACDLWRISRNQ